jgi:hypothetical protein
MIPSLLLAASAGVSLGAALVASGHRFPTRSRLWVRTAAVVSAAGALFADGALTGWHVMDVVARAVLGFVIVLWGARTPGRTMMVSAVVAVIAASGARVHPVAAAAGGLVLPAALSRRRHPLVTGIASGLIVQVALRLSAPDVPAATAALACLILAPVVLSGLSSSDVAFGRHTRRVAVMVGVFALAATGLGLAAALMARPVLDEGISIVREEVVDQGGGSESASDRLLAARSDFRKARRILGSWWARPAAALPLVGQHWRALRAGAVSGEQLSDLGLRTTRSFNLSGLYITDGQVPLDALVSLEPALGDAARTLGAVRRRLTDADSSWLLPPLGVRLDRARERVASAESGTTTAVRVLPHLPALLGSPSPRRYFLAVQTPAELRGSGGFMGNYGEVTADDGKLNLRRFGGIAELMGGDLSSRRLLAPGDFTKRYSRFLPEQEWGNVNLSPDFPTDARVIAGLYPQSGGEPIDGVVAIDPSGLASLLRVVGPVSVRSWPTALTAENITEVLLREQYAQFDQREVERQAFVTDVAEGVWGKLTSGSFPLSRLLGALGPAIDGKHLQFFSTAVAEQRLFEELDAAGAMKHVDGDFLGVITQNAGANKLDVFLHRRVDYRVELDPGSGELRARVRVTLQNQAPRDGLPSYVVGQAIPPVPPGDNKLYLSIYTPWRLTEARIDGKRASVEVAEELDRQVYSSFVVVPAGGRTVVELDLTGRVVQGGSYRLTLHRQPTVAPDEVETAVSVPFGWRVGGLVGTQAERRDRLEADRTYEVTVRRQW